jgi:exonuclease VII large subunit
MNPAATVARGFTITRLSDGRVAASVTDVPPGAEILTTFADGEIVTRREVC